MDGRLLSLLYACDDDTITLDGLGPEIIDMIKEDFVKEHHKRSITYVAKRDYWRTYVGDPRKEVIRKTKKSMIDYLYSYYRHGSLADSTIDDVFERRQIYRQRALNRAAGTIDRDRQAFHRVFNEDFCGQKIKNVTDEDIQAYLTQILDAEAKNRLVLKDRALQDAVRILNGVFDFAMKKDKIIIDNPVPRVDTENYYQDCDLSQKTGDAKIFTPQELERIRAEILRYSSEHADDFIGYAMLLSIETGVRVGEIPVLRWSDVTSKGLHIHGQQRTVKVKGCTKTQVELHFTKNERRHPKDGRYFPLTDAINDILDTVKARQRACNIESEFIFCKADGTWIDKDIYAQRLRRLCKRLGYNITNNHAFRMSLNSNVFIPLGLPVTQRAYLLGHSVETNERFYSHAKTDCLPEIRDLLNSANSAPAAAIHAHTRSKIVNFGKVKTPESRMNGVLSEA